MSSPTEFYYILAGSHQQYEDYIRDSEIDRRQPNSVRSQNMTYKSNKRLKMKLTRRDGWGYYYPDNKCDSHLLHSLVSGYISWPDFQQELKNRGYDLFSLRLYVDKTPEAIEEVIQRRMEYERCHEEDIALAACIKEKE